MVAYITELNDKLYSDFIKNGLVLVDIWAIWCGPCKQISPIVDEISNNYQGRLSVGKLDADSNPVTVTDLGIRSIPTLILYKDGEVVEKLTGMQTKKKLSDIIEQYL